MKNNIVGYLIGFIVFVILIPFFMFPKSLIINPSIFQICFCILFAAFGICLSLVSVIYMYVVAKGNPLDAFNYKFISRTKLLMTEGPYKICRNPMLLGILIYYIGIIVLLWSIKSVIVFIIFILIMAYQIYCEEKRLEKDFSEMYVEYKKKTKRLIPFIW